MSGLSNETLGKIIKLSTQTGARMANAKRDFDAVMDEIDKSTKQQIKDLLKDGK